MPDLVAAVDVGTGSARAGIFDSSGRLLGRAEAAIDTHVPAPGQAEQDSTQIWAAVAAALRAARAEAAAGPGDVAGLAFDATCSIVLRDAAGRPVTASTTGDDRRDTILWLDHRAVDEADACTATGHPALDHLGGAMSPEMAIPKLLWLKRNLPASWSRAARILDLTDFLAWSATGSDARSLCTLACKWAFIAKDVPGLQPDLLAALDLADLPARAGLPRSATPVAADLGALTREAAAWLGLAETTRVACGLIDAHAGALGVLGHLAEDPEAERRLALIAGTSSCLMAFAREPRRTPGLWGPHPDVALPGLWLTEGGQSVSGALLDHLIRARGLEPSPAEHGRIAARIAALRRADPDLAPRLHVLPDFHGNRGPLADARARGTVAGLDMDASYDGLCRLYFRSAVGLALGLRDVLERLAGRVPAPVALHAAGGHARNPLLMELYADATGLPVVEPRSPDAVLLGTAMVAAAGAGIHPSLAAAGAAMSQGGTERRPDPAATPRFTRDWRAYRTLQRQRTELTAIT